MVKSMLLVGCVLALVAGECLGMTVEEGAYVPGVPFGPRARSTMFQIAVSPNESTLYAAYWTSDSPEPVMAYSTLDWSHQVVFTMGRCHGGVALSPDGRYVYATTYYEGGIARYDTSSGELVHLRIGYWALTLSGTPDGNSLLATYNEWTDAPACAASLALVDVSGGAFEVISRLPLNGPSQKYGRGPTTYSQEGSKVYLVTGQSKTSNPRVLEMSFAGALVEERSLVLPFTDPPTNVVRVGDKLYVGSTVEPALMEIDLATFLPTGREFALDQPPFTLGVHPDDRHIFILHDAGSLSVLDAERGDQTCYLTGLPTHPLDIEFTADGSRAFVLHVLTGTEPQAGAIVELQIVVQVAIDIKPRSERNRINLRSRGFVPVAILTTDDFDAAWVDEFSLTLSGAPVRVKGKSGHAGTLKDVDGDGDLDLVVQFRIDELVLEEGVTEAVLEGFTLDGIPIIGFDWINVVPQVRDASRGRRRFGTKK